VKFNWYEGGRRGNVARPCPLGSRFRAGGFYEALANKSSKSDLTSAISFYNENKNLDEEYLARLNEQQRAFFRNYKRLLQNIERAKISVSESIANWALNADLSRVGTYPISVPIDPFREGGPFATLRLDAGKMRKTYEDEIWAQRLRQAVTSTLESAKNELKGQQVTIVLLSGGSSNLRWLRLLLERDLEKALPEAQILELSESYQEIVSKGLATECARRFYTRGFNFPAHRNLRVSEGVENLLR
jgi:hypothetical protein